MNSCQNFLQRHLWLYNHSIIHLKMLHFGAFFLLNIIDINHIFYMLNIMVLAF